MSADRIRLRPRAAGPRGDHITRAGGGRVRRACVVLAFAVTLVALGCQARGGRATVPKDLAFQPVGPWQVGAANAPDPPHTGDNTLTLAVRDSLGRPLEGAAVEVVVRMPAMGTMPAMESRGRVREAEPGIYRAGYGLAMGGEWDVSVRIGPRQGAPVEASYRLSTRVPGLAFEQGTPGAGAAGAAGGGGGAPAGGGVDSVGEVVIDAARRQAAGIRTGPVEMRDLSTTVRASGRVTYDERRQSEVALKFSGWVRDIAAEYVGMPVEAGHPLLRVYSPELWAAQQEYLEALHVARSGSLRAEGVAGHDLADAARRRLVLWDIPAAELDRIARSFDASEELPILAPMSGVVVEKNVVRGSAFTPGQVLFRIARLDTVWVVASVFQMDLPLVREGSPARLLDPYLDERSRHGRVAFIAPTLESETRTGQVRIVMPNPRGDLKPGMFVDVELELPLGRRLAVPETAVLPTGERRIVFVDLGGGRLAPREVRLGHRAAGYYEVLAGLAEGEVVVTSGNFLVASESKLRSATQKW